MGEAVTQLRKFRDSISNYFDDIERGVGKRGSTFTDIDAVSHDKDTRRFLFREFKCDGEPLNKAQRWTLTELAGLPRCTVWFVRRIDGGLIGWAQFGSGKPVVAITETEYRRLLACWWAEQPIVANTVQILGSQEDVMELDRVLVTAADIRWG